MQKYLLLNNRNRDTPVKGGGREAQKKKECRIGLQKKYRELHEHESAIDDSEDSSLAAALVCLPVELANGVKWVKTTAHKKNTSLLAVLLSNNETWQSFWRAIQHII